MNPTKPRLFDQISQALLFDAFKFMESSDKYLFDANTVQK